MLLLGATSHVLGPWIYPPSHASLRPSFIRLASDRHDGGDGDDFEDDPYIAFRSAGTMRRWAPASRGSRWQQRDSKEALAIGELLASKGMLQIHGHCAFDSLQVISRLGEGRFGDVLLCHDARGGKQYAVKMALRATAELTREARVLSAMRVHDGFPTFVHHQPARSDQGELLVMEVLGSSLQERWREATMRDSRSVARVAAGVLRCLRHLHTAGYVHNDLKPENILFRANGSTGVDTVNLIDFGRATCPGLPELARVGGVGSHRWASSAAHNGHCTSAVDDLESAFYVFAFLITGHLPWEQERWSHVADMKHTLLTRDECEIFLAGCDARTRSSPSADALRLLWTELTSSRRLEKDADYDLCVEAFDRAAGAASATN